MDRFLKAIPLRIKMEALVQDLSLALDESSCSTVRRRWGLRRRTRSTGNLPGLYQKTQSDDSSSSVGERMLSRDRGMSSLHQSDSDDVDLSSGMQRTLKPFSLKSRQYIQGNIESDSFNENFSPIHPNTRKYRRRKFKRMAVDPVDGSNPSTSQIAVPVPPAAGSRKKQLMRPATSCENRYNSFLSGKRKRSLRERALGFERNSRPIARHTSSRILALQKLSLASSDDNCMDFTNMDGSRCEMMSSSSLSSSESDAGLYTNDEGREGDDEQSDWFGGDANSVCGNNWWDGMDVSKSPERSGRATDDTDDDSDTAFRAILTGSFKHMSDEAKQAYRNHVMRIQDEVAIRSIRAGRRRIRGERLGFNIMTSANEKLSRFLQDPAQTELRLPPMQQQEREQLCHLANLYSLKLSYDTNNADVSSLLLTKTRNTMQSVKVEQFPLGKLNPAKLHHNLNDFKRRRKTPPSSVHPTVLEVVGNTSGPIPETNIGNQMLRNMGWEPGTGLGAQSSGIQEPVTATIRPKHQGLGHDPALYSN